MSNVKEINGTELQSYLDKSSKLTLVKFGAEWCAPCRMIAPILDELSNQYGEKVDIISVDVDKSQSVAANFGVRGIPAMFFVKDGKVIDSAVGMQPQAALSGKLEQHLAG